MASTRDIVRIDPKFKGRVNSHVARNMRKAAQLLKKAIIQKINVGQPTISYGTQGRMRGLDPSVPPEPPKVVTGTLKNSIKHDVKVRRNSVVARVGAEGSIAPYALRLEKGFFGLVDKKGRKYINNSKARPYVTAALAENRAEILKILARP
jgi:hypothetical protein